MSSTSTTCYDVNVYDGECWNLVMTSWSKKEALARAEVLKKAGDKYSVWKRIERSEMIVSG